MSDKTTPAPVAPDGYDAIEGAVMETARGRWFLAEYARRHRAADTITVLAAMDRLEKALGANRPAPHLERVRMEIREMAQAIARTKSEIASIKPEGEEGRFEEASVELDAIVQATETATGDILSAAETIQEIAWTLREMGTENEVCDLIDTKATDIYSACSFQDITGQRTRKVIGVLRFLEERIDSMMAIWGDGGLESAPPPPVKASEPSLLNGPARPGEGLEQGDVDLMLDDDLFGKNRIPEVPTASLAAETLDAAPIAALDPAPEADPAADLLEDDLLDHEALAQDALAAAASARATAAAALSVDDRPLSPSPRPARTDIAAPPTLPNIDDIEKLSFVEKVALTS
jgi:chemotaxis regulatin CheY-phosphate phosphatase CheZ